MSFDLTAIHALFGWLPPGLEALFIGVLAVVLVVLALKIAKMILDTIPFA